MIQQIRKHLPIVLLIALIALTGCKSKKKAMEAANAAAEKARIEQEQAEKKSKAEELAKQEQEIKERAAREEEALRQQKEAKASTPAVKLGQYFSAISSSTNTTAANNNIKEALTLFASPETPVLIVISNEGGVKDYDKPTTIKDYLNYLKDQKKNINSVSDIKTDGSGKITELELRKD